jgi:hypothetical protein
VLPEGLVDPVQVHAPANLSARARATKRLIARSVSDPDPHSMSSGIRIQIQKGGNQPKKEEKLSLKTRKNLLN